MARRSSMNDFKETSPQKTSSAGSCTDEHDDDDSMASESIYTRGQDEFHTDTKTTVSSIVSGFTNLEISFQKASSTYSAAPLVREVPPAERRLSLYDDIERQITEKAGLEDDWEVEDTFDPAKVKYVGPSPARSDTSQSSGRNSKDIGGERKEGNGGGGSMARRRCMIAVFVVALLAAASLAVVFVVLPLVDGDSSTSSSDSAPASSESSPVPPVVPRSPADQQEPSANENETSEQTTEEGTVGEIDEETENVEPAAEENPATDPDGGENENTSAEPTTQDANEAWGGIYDVLSDLATQCEDSEAGFVLDNIERKCEYLQDNVPAQTIACRPEGAAWAVCRSTCSNCPQV